LSNFSEGNQPEGQFVVNSTNARFFGKTRMPLQLETVMVLLSQSEKAIIGTDPTRAEICVVIPNTVVFRFGKRSKTQLTEDS
jgi:hypothetical protein